MRKSAVLVGALLLLMLAGLLVVVLAKQPGGIDPGRVAPRGDDIPCAETTDVNPPQTTSFTPSSGKEVDKAGAHEDPVEPQPQEAARRLLVTIDPVGNAVSLSVLVEWRSNADEPWLSERVVTNEHGKAQLEAPVEAMLRLQLDSKDWFLPWSNFLVAGGEREAHVTVYQLAACRVRVTFADGKPYAGRLTVKAEGLWQSSLEMSEKPGRASLVPLGWPTSGEQVAGTFCEIVEFEGLPCGVEYTFAAYPTRSGFTDIEKVVSASEISAGALIEVVVPEGISPRTPGKILLTLPGGEAIEGKIILFKVLSDGTKHTAPWGSDTPHESGGLPAGRYVVVVVGASAWRSDEFDLAPGENKQLIPSLSASSSLRGRVVDENGQPVSGAVLAFSTQDLPNSIRWRHAGMRLPFTGEAISSAAGILELADLPAGTFEFQVFAPGMQPWVGYATMIAGQPCDMGDIRLEVAKGRIEVRLPDWDFTTRKLTWSLTDAGRRGIDRGEVESSTLVLDNLPVGRTYRMQISIRTARGSRAFLFIKPFELTLAAPTQEFDHTDEKWPADLD